MLRALSDLRVDHELEDHNAVAESYSGPVDEANNAILLASRFSQSLTTSTGDTWQNLSSISVSGKSASQRVPESLAGQAGELMARAEALLAGANGQVIVESTINGLTLSFSSESSDTESRMALSYWVNVGSDDKSIFAMADLMKLYLIVHSAGAEINIGFNPEGAMATIDISFPNQKGGLKTRVQDSDWLEDIVILFS